MTASFRPFVSSTNASYWWWYPTAEGAAASV